MDRHSLWNFTSFVTSARWPKPAHSAAPRNSRTFRSLRFPSRFSSWKTNSARAFSTASAVPSVLPSLAVLRELEAAKGDVVEGKEFIGGTITVGVIPTVAPYFLPPRLITFSRKFPQVQLTVIEEITPVLLDRLRSGAIDVAILALPIRGHEFDAFPLLTERLFAVLPKKHKLTSRPSLSLKEIRAEPFLLLRDGHCFRDTAVAACDRARLHPQIVFESGQFSSLLSMVGAGMGVSIVPEMAIEKKFQCRYVRIADEQAVRTIGAVVLRGRSLTRAHNAFLSHLRASSTRQLS